MPDAPGCRTGVHMEDLAATAMLDAISAQFAPQPEAPVIIFEGPEGTLHVATQPPVLPLEKEAKHQPTPPKQSSPRIAFGGERATANAVECSEETGDGGDALETVLVPYLVDHGDKFEAICMRHQMSAQELMRINGLSRRSVRPGQTVLVWGQRSRGQQQEELRRSLVAEFRRVSKCSFGEARYYLEENSFDMATALAQRKNDLDWEKDAPQQPQQLLSLEVQTSKPYKSPLPSASPERMLHGEKAIEIRPAGRNSGCATSFLRCTQVMSSGCRCLTLER